MLGGAFLIRRISAFCFTLVLWITIGISHAGMVYAFWPDFLSPGKPQETVSPGSVPATDSAVSGEMIAEAKKLATEGNYDDAIARYTDAINRNPGSAVLYYERGCLYYYRMMTVPSEIVAVVVPSPAGSAESQPEPQSPPGMEPATGAGEPCALALADFNQAIILNSNYGIFFYMRGAVLSVESCPQRNLEKAIEDYDQAIKLSPSNAAFYQERGNTRAKLKQYGPAINDMDQAMRIEQYNYYLYYEKGRIQEQMGLIREAADSYKGALELAPPERMGPFLLALKAARSDNGTVLIADYTDLIRKRPAVSVLYINRGLLYGDEKKYKSAIGDYSTALSFQKDNQDLLFTRGKLYYAAGGKNDALKDFRASCRLNHPAACYYRRILEKEINRGDRWAPFWYSRDNRQYFYDRKNTGTNAGNRRVIRVRIEPDDSQEENSPVLDKAPVEKGRGGYTLEWWELDCSRSQVRISTVKQIDRDGQVMASHPDFEKAFRPVFPDGISDKLFKTVCSRSSDRGTPAKQTHSRQDKPIFSP